MSIQQQTTLADGTSTARDILHRQSNENEKVTFPVDPVALAASYGINTETAILPHAISGIAVRETSQTFRILLNQADSTETQRQVTARLLARIYPVLDSHEAHGFIEPYEQADQTTTDFVDEFAAELLIPASVVRLWWSQGKSIKKIARRFGVTRKCITQRLHHLNLI